MATHFNYVSNQPRCRLKKFICSFLLLGLGLAQAHAQEKPSSSDEATYRSQMAYGINLNSNAGLVGGGMLRYSRAITPSMYHSFSLEVVNVKHPREDRVPSPLTGESFVPGKQNYLVLVRPQYGREFVLFKKSAEQGVQINFLAGVGPTIAIIPPYIIEYENPSRVVFRGQYDPAIHPAFDRIRRAGRFSESLPSSQFSFGVSAKASLSFEFGSFRNNVTGVEIGLQSDFMAQRIIMMPLANNRQNFFSVFVNLFYGSRR